MRAVRCLVGGRHLRRPSFDIGGSSGEIARPSLLLLVNLIEGHDGFETSSRHRPVVSHTLGEDNIRVENAQSSGAKKMALNKLSIDKVDITGKRVLIR